MAIPHEAVKVLAGRGGGATIVDEPLKPPSETRVVSPAPDDVVGVTEKLGKAARRPALNGDRNCQRNRGDHDDDQNDNDEGKDESHRGRISLRRGGEGASNNRLRTYHTAVPGR